MLRHFERLNLIHHAPTRATEHLVLITINDYLGANDSCWPSHETIAEKSKLSIRSVIRILNRLQENNIVLIEHRFRKGIQLSNRYRINWALLTEFVNAQKPYEIGGDNLSQEGDNLALGGVTQCQGGGDTVAPDPFIDPFIDPIKERERKNISHISDQEANSQIPSTDSQDPNSEHLNVVGQDPKSEDLNVVVEDPSSEPQRSFRPATRLETPASPPPPWKVQQNGISVNHPGFVAFLTEQFDGKIAIALGFLANAARSPQKAEQALELWLHYIQSSHRQKVSPEDAQQWMQAFPLHQEWVKAIESTNAYIFEIEHPTGTRQERARFARLYYESRKPS